MRVPLLDEPGVSITDFALAAETLALAVLLRPVKGKPQPPARRWFAGMFASLACASLFGGILHGFFNSPSQHFHMLFWDASLISIGATAVCCFNLAAEMVPPAKKLAPKIRVISILACFGYIAYVVTGYRTFLAAIAFYLPATILLLAAVIYQHKKKKSRATFGGLLGVLLTFVAAAIQQTQFYLDPYVLNHNTMYHVIQGIALFLIFRFADAATSEPVDTVSLAATDLRN